MTERNYPTRMHEVLGVETFERFQIKGLTGHFFLTAAGQICPNKAGIDNDYIIDAINRGIIRKPRLSEELPEPPKEEREMTPEERLLRALFTKSEQDELPDNYPATHLEKADYALFCMHKSLKSISPALGRISRLCGLLRVSEKDGKNTLPDIITHNESRVALKHLVMVKRDVDDAYQEILSICENTKEPVAVSETEREGGHADEVY